MTAPLTPRERVEALLLEINEGRVYKEVGPVTELTRQLAAELEEANRSLAHIQKALGEDCLLHAEARIADLQHAKRQLARYREKYGELE